MLHKSESKFQAWRALAVFDDGAECLLCFGRSTTQVRTGYESAWTELLDAEEQGRVCRIAMQCWRGAADQGRWVAKGDLAVPVRRELAAAA